MKKLHLVIILVITWSMFTQCSAVKRSITPAHYKTIEKQTVLIESVTVVTPDKCKNDSKEKDGDEVIHRGISQRSFARSFTIADDVKVNGAELKDGLLTISCEKIIPEIKKKRLIEIK